MLPPQNHRLQPSPCFPHCASAVALDGGRMLTAMIRTHYIATGFVPASSEGSLFKCNVVLAKGGAEHGCGNLIRDLSELKPATRNPFIGK